LNIIRYNEQQLEKLKQERAALVARAEAVGIDTSIYLEDNVISSPTVERPKVL
jgi:hypothetical protein